MLRAPIVIVGVGNFLMSDEGVGIHAVGRLRQEPWPDGIEILDGGTAGVALLHLIENRKLALIIDCTDFGGSPGEIRVFDPDDLRRDERSESGLHATDLLTALELARRTGLSPERIRIVGIQPKTVAMGQALSKEAAAALTILPARIRTLIEGIG